MNSVLSGQAQWINKGERMDRKERKSKRTEGQMARWREEKEVDGQTDGQTNGWMDDRKKVNGE